MTKQVLGFSVACALAWTGLTVASGPAQADGHIKKGEKVFRMCKACHGTEAGEKKIGPSLFGIVGRQAASVDGFRYSKVLRESGITWNDAELDGFLKSPRKYLKGTKMSFGGVRKDAQRANLIAYLKTLK